MKRRRYCTIVLLALSVTGGIAAFCQWRFASGAGGVRASMYRNRMSHLAGTVTGEGGETAKSGCAGESGDGETALTEPVSANDEFSSLLHAASVPEVTPERASELNQVMDALLDCAEIPGDCVEVMCALARNRRQGEQIRAFALQHLCLWARERQIRGGYDPAAADAVRAREVLRSSLDETATPIGGVALLALDELHRVDSQVDVQHLADRPCGCWATRGRTCRLN